MLFQNHRGFHLHNVRIPYSLCPLQISEKQIVTETSSNHNHRSLYSILLSGLPGSLPPSRIQPVLSPIPQPSLLLQRYLPKHILIHSGIVLELWVFEILLLQQSIIRDNRAPFSHRIPCHALTLQNARIELFLLHSPIHHHHLLQHPVQRQILLHPPSLFLRLSQIPLLPNFTNNPPKSPPRLHHLLQHPRHPDVPPPLHLDMILPPILSLTPLSIHY